MSEILQWVKAYVSLFLAFTIVLYLIPAKEYRGYIRFFLEMVLVLFCLRPLLEISHVDLKKQWDSNYTHFYEEMEKRQQEAREGIYLDQAYIDVFLRHAKEEEP